MRSLRKSNREHEENCIQRSKIPSLVIVNFGKDASSQMNITWHTSTEVEKEGEAFVEYYIKGKGDFDNIDSLTRVEGVSELGDLGSNGKKEGEVIHRVRINDLKANTTYIYRVGDGANWAEGSFKTGVKRGDSFEFVVFGDTQQSSQISFEENWGRAVKSALSKYPDANFMVTLGDSINNGDRVQEWEWYYEQGKDIFRKIPVLALVGNHEGKNYKDKRHNYWYNLYMTNELNGPEGKHKNSTYSVDYGNVHYIGIDTVTLNKSINATNIHAFSTWLDGELKSVRDKDKMYEQNTFIIIGMHYPATQIKSDKENIRKILSPLFEKYDVQLVLSGHDHMYARTNTVTYDEDKNDFISSRGKGVTYVTAGWACHKSYPQRFAKDYHAMVVLSKGIDTKYMSMSDINKDTEWRINEKPNYSHIKVEGNILTYTFQDVDGNVLDRFSINIEGKQSEVSNYNELKEALERVKNGWKTQITIDDDLKLEGDLRIEGDVRIRAGNGKAITFNDYMITIEEDKEVTLGGGLTLLKKDEKKVLGIILKEDATLNVVEESQIISRVKEATQEEIYLIEGVGNNVTVVVENGKIDVADKAIASHVGGTEVFVHNASLKAMRRDVVDGPSIIVTGDSEIEGDVGDSHIYDFRDVEIEFLSNSNRTKDEATKGVVIRRVIDGKGNAVDADIYYTLDGSDPRVSKTAQKYDGNINIIGKQTVKAVLAKDGFYDKNVFTSKSYGKLGDITNFSDFEKALLEVEKGRRNKIIIGDNFTLKKNIKIKGDLTITARNNQRIEVDSYTISVDAGNELTITGGLILSKAYGEEGDMICLEDDSILNVINAQLLSKGDGYTINEYGVRAKAYLENSRVTTCSGRCIYGRKNKGIVTDVIDTELKSTGDGYLIYRADIVIDGNSVLYGDIYCTSSTRVVDFKDIRVESNIVRSEENACWIKITTKGELKVLINGEETIDEFDIYYTLDGSDPREGVIYDKHTGIKNIVEGTNLRVILRYKDIYYGGDYERQL